METKIKALIKELNEASEAYYNDRDELMTNFEWDEKFDELVRLEQESGIIFPESPTQTVSADDVKGAKENHEFPALSLQKDKDIKKVQKWMDDKKCHLSWKLDGLTLVATYDNGKLSKLLTRGNGITGTNITAKASAIMGIPAEIDYKNHFVVRGEAIISYDDFNKLNESGEYSNARNLASGTIGLDNLDEIKRRCIKFVAFTPVYFSEDDTPVMHNSWAERMEVLKELGFETVDSIPCDKDSVTQEIALFTDTVKGFKYPVDGLVIVYDDWAYSKTGSITGHHATKSGFAFKWQDKPVVTTVTDIDYQPTRTGLISQVAIFKPVQIAGSVVSRAVIPNMNYRSELDIKIGDEIEVIKANMIIPQIVKNHDKGKAASESLMERYNYPTVCPCCGSPVGKITSKFGTSQLYCANPSCSAKTVRRISHFASKEGLNIKGLSDSTIKFLLEEKFLKSDSPLALYRMVEQMSIRNEKGICLSSCPGWGTQSVKNLIKAINNSRITDFINFITAMGIPHIGKGQAKLLKAHLDNIYSKYQSEYNPMDLLFILSDQNYDFTVIDGFGDVISSSLSTWLSDSRGLDSEVQQILLELTFTDEAPATTEIFESPITGKTFVITGDVHYFKNRSELQERIESLGGKCTGSVSKKTDYLINNDINSTSGKNRKAKELNIPIITEDEFLSMIK